MRSLRIRLILSNLIPVLVILPVVGLVLSYLLQTQVFVANIGNELIRQAVLVADASSLSAEIWQNPSQAQAFVNRVSPRLSAKLMLLDPGGHLIISSDPNDAQLVGAVYEMPDLQRLLASEPPVEVKYKNSQISDVIVPAVTTQGKVIGFVQLTNPLADIYARSERLSQVLLYVIGGGLFSGVLLGWLLARNMERPLQQTSVAANDLANGYQPLNPLREEGPEEIRRVVRAFNTLIERLKIAEENQKRLLANMVHELGRPLGALLSGIQALRSGADEQPDLRRELLGGMENEVERLQHLLDDLAHFNGRDLHQPELHKQPILLCEWLPLVLSTWSESAAQKNIGWKTHIPDDRGTIDIDPDRMAQAIGNLISNAIEYTPPGGTVTIQTEDTLGNLEIHVNDTGPGIPPDEQKLIFQPFYRGKATRRFSEGMGLGLTIARDLIQAHGGTLSLESVPGQGARFTILLPRAE